MATIVKSLYQAFSTPPLPYHHDRPYSPQQHAASATNTHHHDLGYFDLTINNHDEDQPYPAMSKLEVEQAQEIKRLKRQLTYSNKEITRLKQDHESTLARNASLELQLASYKSQIAGLQSRHLNELSLLRQREGELKSKHYHLTTLYNDGTALLERRSKELKAAEAFLNMTDERPGEDVFQAVADINNETMQVSAAMADLVQYDTMIPLAERPVPASVRLYLSQGLLDELQTRDHTEDPTLVQYALQSCFTYYIGNLLRMFCAGLEPQVDHFLSNLFEKIQNSDTQAVAARWRFMAHKQCRTAPKHLTVSSSIMADFHAILTLAGGTSSSITIPPSLFERIHGVEYSATQVSTLIREKIFSRFYVILLAEVDCLSQTDYMEDVFETSDLESGKAAPFRVWCCPTLGLGYAVKTQRGFEHKVLLKTQVVGESVIDSLDNEPSDLEA